jgi:hypothetical protein
MGLGMLCQHGMEVPIVQQLAEFLHTVNPPAVTTPVHTI